MDRELNGDLVASVIVCTQGERPLLEHCLAALLEQDLPARAFEVVVVVDGDARALASMLPAATTGPSVRVVTERHRGLNVKRNRGAAAARGSALLFTDDDCVPDCGWVRACIDALCRHELVCGRVLPLNQGYRTSIRTASRPRLHRGFLARSTAWCIGCGNNLAVRAATLARLGGFCPRIGVGTWSGAACDTELYVRALRAGTSVAFVPDAVVWHAQPRDRAAWLVKRRAYYRGISWLALREHPRDPAAWLMASSRLASSAAQLVLGAALLRRTVVSRALQECAGALEGFGPHRRAVP